MERCRFRRRGFTWVEMLVITFFLLLAFVFLAPIFMPYHHDVARRASCASNEKQIGLALIQYAQDNDEHLPMGTQPTPGLGWAGTIYPYVKNSQVFRCPEDASGQNSATSGMMSYAYNSNIPRWLGRQHGNVSSNFVPDPTHTVVAFEVAGVQIPVVAQYGPISPDEGAAQGATMFSAAGDGTAGNLHSVTHGPDPVHYATGDLGKRHSPGPNQFHEARHEGGSNFLLADAHARWLKPEAISTGADAPTLNAAQTGTVAGTAAGTANRAYTATFSVK